MYRLHLIGLPIIQGQNEKHSSEQVVDVQGSVSQSPRSCGTCQLAHFGLEFDGLEALEWLVPPLPSNVTTH